MFRTSMWLAVLTVSLSFTGCNEAEKKAAEAKALAEKQTTEAKASADKQLAELKAAAEKQKAAAEQQAAEAMGAQKGELLKRVGEGVEAMDRKVAFLKEKAAKLPAGAQAKATAALAAFDTAKASVIALKDQLAGATDPAAVTELSGKATSTLADAQTALDAAESSIMKK